MTSLSVPGFLNCPVFTNPEALWSPVLLDFFKSLFMLRERERVSMCVSREEAEREGERERIPSRLCAVRTEPHAGFSLMNHEIMTWVTIESRMLNRLSHPGAPFWIFMELLLYRHDWLNQWPLMTDSTFCPSSLPGGQGMGLGHGWFPWQASLIPR